MRTHHCGHTGADLTGQTLRLCGWVNRRRDHGGVIFVDLRDRTGLLQIVCNPEQTDLFAKAESLRNEYCIQVQGHLRPRPEGTVNPNMPSGEVELVCDDLTILNASAPLPFQLDDDTINEGTRLLHRVLDLRRDKMQNNMRLRHQVTQSVRRFLDGKDFVDIETPMLTKSTPEGARDYLVPSRVQAGEFFALPQSPQLFKQLLMVAGFERYYQIARCFRDEDLRADRQPEFTQIDIETSFLSADQIRDLFEEMIRQVFAETLAVKLDDPFPVLEYDDALRLYGNDKPDLRVKLELTELTEVMRDVDFKVFAAPANAKSGRVAALRIPGGATMSRGELDLLTELAKTYGAKGLAWIKSNDVTAGRDGLQSPIVKNIHDDAIREILQRSGAANGDLLLFGADQAKVVNDTLAALRLRIGHSEFGKKAGLFVEGWRPLWVVNFPMFERDSEVGRWVACHHPFTSPRPQDIDKLASQPGDCRALAYDMVLNGWEIGGGSVRIHQEATQNMVFAALGLDEEQARSKFGFLLDALKYGAPPHGGIAFGLDRIVTLMAGASSIRDVIAFPKTQRAQCLLTEAPSAVDEKQLRELNIRLRMPPGGTL